MDEFSSVLLAADKSDTHTHIQICTFFMFKLTLQTVAAVEKVWKCLQ